MRARYYSDITDMDEGIGNFLDAIKEHGLEQNSLTIWTADHGANWPHGKYNLYDAGMSVPCIARWPGHIQPATVSDAMISYVDFVPTLLSFA